MLYVGAELLVRGGSSLASRLGVSPLIVGLTVIAYGTSAPELLVSTQAALANQGAIAVGNVVGSNIFNIAVILGLSAIIFPIKINSQVLRFDTPVMVGVSFFLFMVLSDGVVTQIEGVLLLGSFALYSVGNVHVAHRSMNPLPLVHHQKRTASTPGHLWKSIALVLGGLVVLFAGARLTVDGAVDLARGLGVSDALVGLSLVAAGTSIPELATAIVAMMRKESDIAVGNVIGSNIFNILFVLGVSSTVHPTTSPGIIPLDLWVMVGMAILTVPFMWTGFVLRRWEGVVLCLLYAAYWWFRSTG